MPAHFYLDDLMISSNSISDLLAFYASAAAILDLGIESELAGEPLVFRPINPSPYTAQLYLNRFHHFMQELLSAVPTNVTPQ